MGVPKGRVLIVSRIFLNVVASTTAATLLLTATGAMPRTAPAMPLQSRSNPTKLLREFRPIGNRGNNRNNRNDEALAGDPELAIVPPPPPNHGGGGLPLGPNPRTVSNVIGGGTGANGNNGQTTDPLLSAWLYVFGQFVDHDISLEETPLTNPQINVVIPPGDPVFAPGSIIAMTRDTRNPQTNTIVNTVAGYLNLSQIYGQTPAVAATLENPDGTLTSSGNGLYLPIVNGVFVTGDPRVMENPELTAVTTLFMREHNYWVRAFKAQNPSWTGTQLYSMARAVTIGEYQNIVYSAYLPHLIGPALRPYAGYNSQTNPQVTQEFSTAAFRVGHSQVSDTQEGLASNGSVLFTESLATAFFNTPALDVSNGVDPILRSLGVDYSQATDVYTVSALRNLLFAGLVGGEVDKIDLIAIDIQRERDVELGSLNQTRQALHMQPYKSFGQLTSDPVLQASFQNVYGNINSVDLFMGGLAEAHAPGANVGPTFQAIIADQFTRLRSGDRFYWQNAGFDQQTAQMISKTTLATLLNRDTVGTAAADDLFVAAAIPGHRKRHIKLPLPVQ
jgi:peroxidase